MEIEVVDRVNIGDSIFGIRIYSIDGYHLQNHISIAIFPVRISILYIYPIKRLEISLKLFSKFLVTLGIGVGGENRR